MMRARARIIPARIREQVLEQYGYQCQWCLVQGGALDLHHRLRRSQGGKDDVRTLIPAHRLCHDQIHREPAEGFRRGFLVHSADELSKGLS